MPTNSKVLREEAGLKVVRVGRSKPVPYAVYDGDNLICYCMYKRGANSLVDYLLRLMGTEVAR